MAVSPQTAQASRETAERLNLVFPLLIDAGNALAETFGLKWTLPDDLRQLYLGFGIDLPASNGDESWSLPIPARYVIDTGGIIRWASVSPDHTTRPEVGVTLSALRKLG